MDIRDKLDETKNKGEDDFEKNLVLITTGTLVLSMTFIEKIAPLDKASGVWFLIFAWSSLAISLLLNLVSHRISAQYAANYIREFDKGTDHTWINDLIDRNNKKMANINSASIALLITGILCLVVYCSINAYQMSKKDKPPVTKNLVPENKGPKSDPVKLGRETTAIHIPKPPEPKPAPKDNKNDIDA